ncbi:Glutamyl-tRNA(Gln) synthetase [hydrothermal vent metagenome]|uniref:Glutamyl-tRNA(Gln) synthetase n=1 Tax=hydrothermal vent metagenome TaxID=652676 RepID=A0A1W1EF94_9ZZZZ
MLRFAPSPTVDMDIASLRVAILNYIVAKQKNEPFLIRMDDIDKEKNIEGKDTEFMQILEKFALNHESVFHQSEHIHMHQTLAIRLLEEDKAFICTCTQEELNNEEENNNDNIDFPCHNNCKKRSKDESAKLKKSGKPFVVRLKNQDEDFVILDSAGMPTQNFASACDDMISGVNFIIRTDKHLLDTPKQKHIKSELGYDAEVTYIHLPAILNSKGEKLSQSDDGYFVKWLLKEGFIPDAIINYLILLGNKNVPKEVFTLPDAIDWFNLENIDKSPVKLDIDKLRFINREHLKNINNRDLSTVFGFADENIGKLAKLYLEEVSTTKELEAKIRPIFTGKNFEGSFAKEMRILEKIIQEAPMIYTFDEFKSYILKESKLEEDSCLKALRILLTGADKGPELSDIYPLIKSYILEVAS